MKNKLTHTLRPIPAGSIPMRKGTTLLSNKGHFHLWLPNLGPTQVCQNVTGCGPSASARALQDLGELHSLTERDSSFLCSTPGAVPLVPNMHSRINQPKPTCIWTGWRLQVIQKTILNTQCINHSCRGERDPREECNDAHSPNLELMLLLDPSLIPDTLSPLCFRKKGP